MAAETPASVGIEEADRVGGLQRCGAAAGTLTGLSPAAADER